jgi:hypothetical protein
MLTLFERFKKESKTFKIVIIVVLISIVSIISNAIIGINMHKEESEKISEYIDPRPGDQISFVSTFKTLKDEFNNAAGNDIVQNELASKIKNYLSTPRNITNWIARVQEIPGSIKVDFDNPELETIKDNENYIYEHFGVMYLSFENNEILKKLRPGDYVIFSGQILSELSFTDKGSVDQPEISIKANSCEIFNR